MPLWRAAVLIAVRAPSRPAAAMSNLLFLLATAFFLKSAAAAVYDIIGNTLDAILTNAIQQEVHHHREAYPVESSSTRMLLKLIFLSSRCTCAVRSAQYHRQRPKLGFIDFFYYVLLS